MESETNNESLEEEVLNRLACILETLPNKGENINLDYLSKECKKIEVCSRIA